MSPSPEDLIHFRAQARLLLSLVAIVWLIHLVNWMFSYRSGGRLKHPLNQAFGLRPRNLWGLVGIPCSPLLHSSWSHLRGNTIAFLGLGWLVSLQGIHLFYVVTLAIVLIGGILEWMFGTARPYSVGASGVIFGYIGFLLIYGLLTGNLAALLAALVTGYQYRTNIIGGSNRASAMLPHPDPTLCWDGHLYGFIAGVATAYLMSDLKLSDYQ